MHQKTSIENSRCKGHFWKLLMDYQHVQSHFQPLDDQGILLSKSQPLKCWFSFFTDQGNKILSNTQLRPKIRTGKCYESYLKCFFFLNFRSSVCVAPPPSVFGTCLRRARCRTTSSSRCPTASSSPTSPSKSSTWRSFSRTWTESSRGQFRTETNW